jgi:hypothetical protein
MADWIKVRHALTRSPKILRLATALKVNQATALGIAVKWLCWLDEQTETGCTGLLPDELDLAMGFRGCANALISIGWAALGGEGAVVALEFGKHSGETAKKRAENALRQEKFKLRQKNLGMGNAQGNANALPNALPEENRKEENNTSISSSSLIPLYTERASFAPPREQVATVMSSVKGFKLSDNDLSECIAKWLDVMQSTGWRDQKGREIVDWAPAARLWARSWAEHERKKTKATSSPSRPERDCNYGKSDRY